MQSQAVSPLAQLWVDATAPAEAASSGTPAYESPPLRIIAVVSLLAVFQEVERVAVITLRPTAPACKKEARKKVVWTEDTVDNEHMNKKKSKCCCIYEKPRRFDESDSEESDDECEHCFGHVERRHQHNHQEPDNTIVETEETAQEPTATISLQPGTPAPAPPDKAPAS